MPKEFETNAVYQSQWYHTDMHIHQGFVEQEGKEAIATMTYSIIRNMLWHLHKTLHTLL